ncbi:MAG: hypothetical protein Q9162_005773 [Coniocarpon cinnabarinum]
MAGAGKHRARKERRNGNGNGNKSPESPESPETQDSPSPNSPPEQASPPTRYDGGADPGAGRPALFTGSDTGGVVAVKAIKNLDLGLRSSYLQLGLPVPNDLPTRPGQINPTGQAIQVRLNGFPVSQLPTRKVFQYDVQVGSGNEKKGLNNKAWHSADVQRLLTDNGTGWIYDGNKIAYGPDDIGKEFVVSDIDLDKASGREPKPGKSNTTRLVIRMAKTVRMDSLKGYLDGTLKSWDNNCIEAMTFLDHLLREQPSQYYTVQKRNFFRRGQTRTLLGGGIEAMKGVYASMRAVSAGISPPKAQLAINVDVANTTFWAAQPLHTAARELINVQDLGGLVQKLRPERDGSESFSFRLLRRLRKLGVTCKHRDEKNPDSYIIDKFIMKNAQEQRIELKGDNGQQSQWVSIENYFQTRYQCRLQYPQLPVVKMTKGQNTYIPMELCRITENQRYGFKLSDKQTSEMIKFAVTLPPRRWADIESGVGMFNWGQDKYLAKYGLRVLNDGQTPTQVTAKLLPPPRVNFGNSGDATPQYSGRWDLRGKKFIEVNQSPLQCWGVCVVPDRQNSLDPATVQNFIRQFIRIYEGHGGRVARKDPVIIKGVNDAAKCVEMLWTQTGNQSKQPPQLLMFVVPNRDAQFYSRIKKSTDCRYGVVSQVLQAAHVVKAQAQYCSNVCMKVNAKLGGATARAVGVVRPKGWINRSTMYVGADVSHAAPGADVSPSIAAITVSFDKQGLKYAGTVESNGHRVEMITQENWDEHFGMLCDRWIQTLGGGQAPKHVVYFRDGVSEGQYAHVLQQEVRDMKNVLKKKDEKTGGQTQFTVVTATKRHHVRFFPQKGDRNGNPLPGTLVEQGITHPYEYDFYLCAHSAIKGTARPVHYYVLMDEAKLGQEEIENMIYEASYQYVRSTTPVSIHPAIYYAHLAAARGTSHINQPSQSSGPEDQTKTGSSGKGETEIAKLLTMPNNRGIRGVMWYI